MRLRHRINLIPRNNWDYGVGALFSSFARGNADRTSGLEDIFVRRPLWTNSGRTSLFAILKALEMPVGAQVGVPLFCCSVVFNAICQAGLIPRFLDSNLDDCNVSVADLRQKRVDLAAVVAVHMFGHPCDMDELLDATGSLPVIEDCAQSIFSTYKGKLTGSLSTASFFSFRCGKYISAGEGSAILCHEPALQGKVERIVDSFDGWPAPKVLTNALSTFVKAALYNRPLYGLVGHPVGMRLDKKLNLTAKDGFEAGKVASSHRALVEARMGRFPEKVEIQRQHAEMLLSALKPRSFSLPSQAGDCGGNWFQFPLRFQCTDDRDAMAAYLLDQGIDTAKYLDTIVEEARSSYGYHGDCPNAELLSKTILLVPIHYTLHKTDIEHIAASINQGSELISKRKGR